MATSTPQRHRSIRRGGILGPVTVGVTVQCGPARSTPPPATATRPRWSSADAPKSVAPGLRNARAARPRRQTHVSRDDWKMCTVDGFVYESANSTDPLGVLEIKTTSDSAADWAESVPVTTSARPRWAMHVTDLPACWFAVLHLAFGRPQFGSEVRRDVDDETFVLGKCETFWIDRNAHRYTAGRRPAPCDDRRDQSPLADR